MERSLLLNIDFPLCLRIPEIPYYPGSLHWPLEFLKILAVFFLFLLIVVIPSSCALPKMKQFSPRRELEFNSLQLSFSNEFKEGYYFIGHVTFSRSSGSTVSSFCNPKQKWNYSS